MLSSSFLISLVSGLQISSTPLSTLPDFVMENVSKSLLVFHPVFDKNLVAFCLSNACSNRVGLLFFSVSIA